MSLSIPFDKTPRLFELRRSVGSIAYIDKQPILTSWRNTAVNTHSRSYSEIHSPIKRSELSRKMLTLPIY
jgi:hypothetical protein